MNASLLLRLVLDGTAAAALLAALAYYWLDNTTHELIGTGMFLLLITHAVFHRRWFGTTTKKLRDGAALLNLALTLLLLIAMLVLLASSLLISHTFSLVALEDGVTARQIHKLAAHWVVLLASIHIGLRWPIVMAALRRGLGLTTANRARTAVLRVLALGLALHGVQASFEMVVGSKLLFLPVLDMWDFNESTPRFFLNYLSIVGLYAVLTHYAMQWMQRRRRGGTVAASAAS